MTIFGSWKSYTFVAGLAASLSGCDGVTDDDYRGTPLAKLEGVVTSESGAPRRDVAAAVIWTPNHAWYTTQPRNRTLSQANSAAAMGTLVDIEGEFPASFRIAIYEPPPELALEGDWDDTAFSTAQGRVVAVDRARVVDNGDGTFDLRDALIGSSDQVIGSFETTQFVLWYLSQSSPDSWPSPMTQGYHLHENHGYLSCNTFGSLADCIAFQTMAIPGLEPDVIEAFCRSAHQVIGSGGAVPMDTPLTIQVSDQPLFIAPEGGAGIYSAHDIPTCPSSDE